MVAYNNPDRRLRHTGIFKEFAFNNVWISNKAELYTACNDEGEFAVVHGNEVLEEILSRRTFKLLKFPSNTQYDTLLSMNYILSEISYLFAVNKVFAEIGKAEDNECTMRSEISQEKQGYLCALKPTKEEPSSFFITNEAVI